MFVRFATAAAALALMSGVALAQSTAPQTPPEPAPATAAPADPMMPAALPAMTLTPTAPSTMPAPLDPSRAMTSSMPAEQQATLKAGDPGVVSNLPVADTPENRIKYGSPASNAGKRSAAKGN